MVHTHFKADSEVALYVGIFRTSTPVIHYQRAFVQAAGPQSTSRVRFTRNDVASFARGKPHLSIKKETVPRIRDAIVRPCEHNHELSRIEQ